MLGILEKIHDHPWLEWCDEYSQSYGVKGNVHCERNT